MEFYSVKVLNFGSLNLDHVYQVDHFFQPGETLSAFSQAVNPGGKGLNQSIALAKAGAEVYHAGCVGRGGEPLVRLLSAHGVDTRWIRPVEELQGNAVIQVTPAGENCILLFGGSNRCVTEKQIQETLSHFNAGDYLILQNEINRLPRIVDEAFARGMQILLNPSPYNRELASLNFSRLSWLLVNEVEAAQITGTGDPDKAWAVLHEKWPQLSAVITLGSRGSVVYCANGETVRQPADPAKAVDTTAAGDTFTGYFVAGLMAGLSLERCMKRASLAASISVTRAGAAQSIPAKEEVNA